VLACCRANATTCLVDPAVVGRGEKAKNLWENACIKVHDVMGRHDAMGVQVGVVTCMMGREM